jgi:hypothetical protein
VVSVDVSLTDVSMTELWCAFLARMS